MKLEWDNEEQPKAKELVGEYKDKGVYYNMNMEPAAMLKYAEMKNLPIHNIIEAHDTLLAMSNSIFSPYTDLSCRVPDELWKFIGLNGWPHTDRIEEAEFMESVRESPKYFTGQMSVRTIKNVTERLQMSEEELREEYGYKLKYEDSKVIGKMIKEKPSTIGEGATIQDVLDKYLKDANLSKTDKIMAMDIVLHLSRRYVVYNVHLIKDLTIEEVMESKWEEDVNL